MRIAQIAGLACVALMLMYQPGHAMPSAYTPPAGLKVVEQGDGLVFRDASGMTLYSFAGDEAKPGTSSCNGPCAQQWPPVLAPADAKPDGAWSIVARDDGTRQWAVDGKPLYRYAQEGGPGTTFGDNDGNWFPAFAPIWTPPGVTVAKTPMGTVLADAKGLTLYIRGNKSSCTASCLANFVPVTAPALAIANGPWSVVTRDDSAKQWAYQGKPLYRSLLDVKAGEANGDGTGLDEGWRAVVLEPAPPLPSWVTMQETLGGEVFADAHGLTLYFHGGPRRTLSAAGAAVTAAKPPCATAGCMGNEWKAVLAAAETKPVGNWTILANDDGTRQWAYKGVRLYTNAFEEKAGQLKGLRFGGDRSWKVVTRSGTPIQNN